MTTSRVARTERPPGREPFDILTAARRRQVAIQALDDRTNDTVKHHAISAAEILRSAPMSGRRSMLEGALSYAGHLIPATPALRKSCSAEAILAGARFESDVYELQRMLLELLLTAHFTLDATPTTASERLALETLSFTFDRDERRNQLRETLLPFRNTPDAHYSARLALVASTLKQLRTTAAFREALNIVRRHLNYPLTERNLCSVRFFTDLVLELEAREATGVMTASNIDGLEHKLQETFRLIALVRRKAQRKEARALLSVPLSVS